MANSDNSTDTLAEWDFNKFHVQENVSNKDYIGAHSVLIAAGPPKLSQLSAAGSAGFDDNALELGLETSAPDQEKDVVFPIGIIQNMSMQQNRNVQRIFEVGSERSYFIPGRLAGRMNLSRVMYHGPSLLRAMTAYYDAPKNLDAANDGTPHNLVKNGNFDDASQNEAQMYGEEDNLPKSGEERPGSNTAFFINMASEFFDRPIGLMFYLKDNADRTYGHFYVESAFVNSHQLQMGAGSTVVSESASLQFDRAKPVKITSAFQNN